MYRLRELEKLIWPGKLPPSPTQTVSPFDSRVMPALMASKLTLIAKSRIDWFAFVKLPYLKLNSPSILSWKVFEFTTSKPILYAFANSFSSLKSLTLSHGKWGETFSVIPTRSFITAQSSIFSKILFGSPIPGNLAKRVPPVPTPQVGTATWNFLIFSLISWISIFSFLNFFSRYS